MLKKSFKSLIRKEKKRKSVSHTIWKIL